MASVHRPSRKHALPLSLNPNAPSPGPPLMLVRSSTTRSPSSASPSSVAIVPSPDTALGPPGSVSGNRLKSSCNCGSDKGGEELKDTARHSLAPWGALVGVGTVSRVTKPQPASLCLPSHLLGQHPFRLFRLLVRGPESQALEDLGTHAQHAPGAEPPPHPAGIKGEQAQRRQASTGEGPGAEGEERAHE